MLCLQKVLLLKVSLQLLSLIHIFSEMASMTGGGVQTPGFMGHGKHFISSKKFMKAEGGIERIVWMPKELKERCV